MNSLDRAFWSSVQMTATCWTWTRTIVGAGYGQLRLRHSSHMSAHRFSWEIHYGPIPQGLCVLHRCDNPACVRPDHLFLGTNKDNTHDMVEKGRWANGNMLKTYCKHGHELTPENTKWVGTWRQCKTCNRLHEDRRNEKRRQVKLNQLPE